MLSNKSDGKLDDQLNGTALCTLLNKKSKLSVRVWWP
jgi:hypothetical protein